METTVKSSFSINKTARLFLYVYFLTFCLMDWEMRCVSAVTKAATSGIPVDRKERRKTSV